MLFPSIPVRYSLLSASALGALVQTLWSLEVPIQCQLLQTAQSGGNDLYLITSGNSHFVLRVFLYNSDLCKILEARAQMLDALAQRHIAVNQPFPNANGTFTAPISAPEGLRYIQLFAFAPGTPPGWQMSEKQATLYGRTVARLHETADLLPHQPDLPAFDDKNLLHAPVQVLLSFLADESPQAKALKELEELLQKRIALLPHTLPAYGFCHADCHKMNALCTQDGQLTLIDFDCSGYSWRAYELSVLLWSLSRLTDTGEMQYEQRLWDAYINGYQQIRSLDTQTLEAIPWFVLVRYIW